MKIMDNENIDYLYSILFDENNMLRILPASEYEKIPFDHLRLFCHHKGLYTLPTQELIEYLREQIGDKKAIEIGCGHGAIGRALGIPRTDSKQQERADIKLIYEEMNQPSIIYPDDVEKLEALEAIKKYKPDIVIGSWITDVYRPKLHHLGGNMWGVNEEKIRMRCKTYIHIGCRDVHEQKLIRRYPHKEIYPLWLWGRAAPGESVVYIWER